jgi:hypothetical protein
VTKLARVGSETCFSRSWDAWVADRLAAGRWLPDATLIIYPDSGHGAHFQYPQSLVTEARLFLDGQPDPGHPHSQEKL